MIIILLWNKSQTNLRENLNALRTIKKSKKKISVPIESDVTKSYKTKFIDNAKSMGTSR